ncbi:hypothetical protein EYC79_09475 [Agrobacterium cavarae]|uniref:DUF5680 domain-containing protein n=1 Tax=Agrobacterium cavarae TaxID=2528239 RepID=A0ABY1YAG0_9HYPH|nr:DUF5680 domain-containing protein [Agrobacterium cavarae]TBN13429.1 hypothetical protein EYC79_09475 [Agrobacterium cavarae]
MYNLNNVIVRAKAACYVGGGAKGEPSRRGSQDLIWSDAEWEYRDSYFSGTNFIGQEVLWLRRTPYWAMNYYSFIIRPDLIDGERAGSTIKAALSRMYRAGRFLGGFEWAGEYGTYIDRSEGDARHFHGREVIMVGGEEAYALHYCGGLIIP